MSNEIHQPHENILAGRRALEGIEGFCILQDWFWNGTDQVWVLHCRISFPTDPGGAIPRETDWYITITNKYPFGTINFYPASHGGIEQTFQHQQYNGRVLEGLPWRGGNICVDYPLRILGRNPWLADSYEPNKRLKAYVLRAIEWIQAAACHDLVREGEPFELPDFDPNKNFILAFNESEKTFGSWLEFPECIGLAVITKLKPNIFALIRFDARGQRKCILPSWGNIIGDPNEETEIGIWIRLADIPVFSPWQAPRTLSELRNICLMQGINIDDVFDQYSNRLRDGKRHLLVVGFPIPAVYGESTKRIHWQGLLLPPLSHGKRLTGVLDLTKRGIV